MLLDEGLLGGAPRVLRLVRGDSALATRSGCGSIGSGAGCGAATCAAAPAGGGGSVSAAGTARAVNEGFSQTFPRPRGLDPPLCDCLNLTS